MKLHTLNGINLKNKSVLLRIDINSPVINGKIIDNPRFEASARTIKYLLDKKAKITIIAHQGRKGDNDFTSLKQHAKILSRYARKKIEYINDLFGKIAENKIKNLPEGNVILLKNVREYNDELNIESKNNRYKNFCKLFDLYINEAFSVSHRNQGSIIIPPKYLHSVIGLEFENELKALEEFKKSNAKRKIFILGGAKTEDYFPLFKFLKDKKNKILAAGILANLFLMAKGCDLGYEKERLKSYHSAQLIPKLKKIYNKYQNQIILPVDFGLITEKGKRLNATLEQSPFPYKIYDVGEKTVKLFKEHLGKTNYIFMKGPLGFSEIPEFSRATKEILSHISTLTKSKKIFSIIGGGHLTATIKRYKIPKSFSYVSLSGGALIAYISGKTLPGIIALKKSKK